MKSTTVRTSILDTALALARRVGFEALSIGSLAKAVGMSKSGLFAHFKSKESLQMMVLDHAAQNFSRQVFRPAISSNPRGVKRLRAIVDNWFEWSGGHEEGGCPFLAATVEFDDRPGKVNACMRDHLNGLRHSLLRACELCIESGDFRPDTPSSQVAFEIYGIITGHHIYTRTLGSERSGEFARIAVEALLDRYLIKERS